MDRYQSFSQPLRYIHSYFESVGFFGLLLLFCYVWVLVCIFASQLYYPLFGSHKLESTWSFSFSKFIFLGCCFPFNRHKQFSSVNSSEFSLLAVCRLWSFLAFSFPLLGLTMPIVWFHDVVSLHISDNVFGLLYFPIGHKLLGINPNIRLYISSAGIYTIHWKFSFASASHTLNWFSYFHRAPRCGTIFDSSQPSSSPGWITSCREESTLMSVSRMHISILCL